MKILAVSDIVVDWIYSPKIRLLLSDTDIAIGCGDLPHYYLEFIVSTLDILLLNVHGNHTSSESGENQGIHDSHGLVDLHRKVKRYKGFTFAGVEGSLKYNDGKYQYSQFDMWLNVFRIVPALLASRIFTGKFLNVFVSHAPPWGIQDQSDYPHQGIKAFRWLLRYFQPDYHIHGHIHIYRPDMVTETIFGRTRVINAYGYRKIEL